MANNINDYEITGAIIKGKVPNKKYKDGWDRIFGAKPNDKQFDEIKKKRKGRS